MGTFTLALHEILESPEDSGALIGLGDYPIFDESYRETLNRKIIEQYWNQEIGTETVEMFTFYMRRKMHQIMPRYNELYKMQALKLDPLVTFRTKSEGENDSETEATNAEKTENTTSEAQNSTQNGTNDSSSRVVNSTFPQTMISETGDYATDASDSVSKGASAGNSQASVSGTSQGKADATSVGKASAKMAQASEGFSGITLPGLIASFNDLFINTDMEVITELQTLFMGIWDTGDSFTRGGSSWYTGL